VPSEVTVRERVVERGQQCEWEDVFSYAAEAKL
jgi:hypothetical protein